MRKLHYIVIIGALSYGTTQAWWGWVGAAAAFFFANKGMDTKQETVIQHGSHATTAKVDTVSGDAYIACTFENTGVPDETRSALGARLNNLYIGCSTKAQTSFAWLCDNKMKVFGLSVATIYGYTLMRIMALQRFMKSSHCWGAWHEEIDLSNVSHKDSIALREELLVEVRHRYPKSDDLVPVHSFIHDLEQEIAVYNNYQALVERVTRADSYEKLVTDRFKDAYAGLLGNTPSAHAQGAWLFDWLSVKRWLCVDEQALERCKKRREHVMHLKAFYAEWLTTVRAIYKQVKS